ncbi:class I SAM-dependent methyltransferase [Pseudoduganella violaceinigra]|uniref:class I SAM-dependent methyltransferase n=1 Tax=Pseudoduganella violaceinigra TaxID=246602 RepID=UPI0004246F67|nr:methyltransferase domain-containing protein [Pseudoduganella violaceinigra]
MNKDSSFTGSIPETYERAMVPLLFAPYAIDMARRAARNKPQRVLEIAAGTGAVTRRLIQEIPGAHILATDLNSAMLEQARKAVHSPHVEWREADGQQLPFPDASFDAVICQFGIMFFPDKARGFSEARRVLKPGGRYYFSVWGGISHNDFSATINHALAKVFPDDPPRFLARVPYGWHDVDVILDELKRGGWSSGVTHEVVKATSRADSAALTATALCQGSPLRADIEARDPARLQEATDAAIAALTEKYGSGAIEGGMQAIVFTCEA